MKHWEDEEIASRSICSQCIGEPYLSKDVQNNGKLHECGYCRVESPTFTLSEVADRIEQAFDQHYSRTASEPDGYQWAMQKDPESEYSWEREGEQTIYAIMNAAMIDEGPPKISKNCSRRDTQTLKCSRWARRRPLLTMHITKRLCQATRNGEKAGMISNAV